MMQLTAIVLAAGKSERLKLKVSKPLFKINHQPILIYSLKALSDHPLIADIVVVANASNRIKIIAQIKKARIGKIKAVVLGGRRRQDSVINGLKAVSSKARFVLIHDAARPFINKKILTPVINKAVACGAAILGVPVKATIKEVGSKASVAKTLDRSRLWEIQTPQVFSKDLLFKAYKKFGNSAVTDDASLVEKLGHRVTVVMGSYHNIKITTAEDLVLAQAIAKQKLKKCLI